MNPVVDVLTVNRCNLPWLKLLVKQIGRFNPAAPSELFVWDNASSDGSREWLSDNKIKCHLNPEPGSHAQGLIGLMERSSAPYAAFIDVDAFPIKAGWLDDAVEILKDEKVGAAGLFSRLPGQYHKDFVHPSYCVFRREIYQQLKLDPRIVHDYDGTAFDVGEMMCARIEEAGYRLHPLGKAMSAPGEIERLGNKVVHAWVSWHMMVNADFPAEAVGSVVSGHRALLSALGLWEEFLGYVRESVSMNPLCGRYF